MSKAGKPRLPEYPGHILEAMTEVEFLADAKTQDAII